MLHLLHNASGGAGVRTREGGAGGFTLIELLLAMVVVAMLAAIAIPAYGSYIEKAKVSQAESDISGIEERISRYQAVNGSLPASLSQVGEGALLDPWGNPYHYLVIAGLTNLGKVRKDKNLVPLNSDYDLFSAGANGQWQPPIVAPASQDDILRANNGGFLGLASDY